MAKTTQADPFDFWRLYGQEKYSLQNMEVKSFKFPYEVEERHIHCVYDDRLPHGIWQDATRLIETGATGDAFFNGATDESFLKFAQRIADYCEFKHKVTGARIVRFTNAGGYPCYRLDMAHGGKMSNARTDRQESLGLNWYGDQWR